MKKNSWFDFLKGIFKQHSLLFSRFDMGSYIMTYLSIKKYPFQKDSREIKTDKEWFYKKMGNNCIFGTVSSRKHIDKCLVIVSDGRRVYSLHANGGRDLFFTRRQYSLSHGVVCFFKE